jgi:hypothetical protein
MNPEMHLLDLAMLDQVEGELAAAVTQQVAGVMCLEPAYLLDEIALDEIRVPLEGIDQGRGSDVLLLAALEPADVRADARTKPLAKPACGGRTQ